MGGYLVHGNLSFMAVFSVAGAYGPCLSNLGQQGTGARQRYFTCAKGSLGAGGGFTTHRK